jgi:hypothetical protein
MTRRRGVTTDQLTLFEPGAGPPDEAAAHNAYALGQARQRAAEMRDAEELHRVIQGCIRRAARANGWTGPDSNGHMIPPPQPPPKPKKRRTTAARIKVPRRGKAAV